jgi:hypothetical protein
LLRQSFNAGCNESSAAALRHHILLVNLHTTFVAV